MSTVAETIKSITHKHLDNGGLFFGQCVTAVGWIGGTVPELPDHPGIIELPTSDSSNPGVVCGAALAGKRPIYAIRYQGFMTYNGCSILNYAAISKSMWNTPCPVFVRSIGMEGSIGPVAGGMHHGVAYRHPGIKTFVPMTPKEWAHAWQYFMDHDDPVYCSENRLSFKSDREFENHYVDTSFNDYPTLILIGPVRLQHDEIVKWFLGKVNIIHLFDFSKEQNINDILPYMCNHVYIIDSELPNCSLATQISYDLMRYGVFSKVINLDHKVSGFGYECDNKTKTVSEIYDIVSSEMQ